MVGSTNEFVGFSMPRFRAVVGLGQADEHDSQDVAYLSFGSCFRHLHCFQ